MDNTETNGNSGSIVSLGIVSFLFLYQFSFYLQLVCVVKHPDGSCIVHEEE